MALVVLLGLGFSLTGAALAQPALACSCAGVEDDAGYAGRADAVFTGRLVDRAEQSGGIGSSTDPATLTFEVFAVYKGEVSQPQQVVTAVSGASCGLELSGEGPHLIFARTNTFDHDPPAADGQLRADLCGGSRPLAAGEPDVVLGAPSPPMAGDGSGLEDTREPARPTASGGWPAPMTVGTAVAAGAAAICVLGWRRRDRPSR